MIEFRDAHPVTFSDDRDACEANLRIAVNNAKLPGSQYLDVLMDVLCALYWNGTSKELMASLPLTKPLGFEEFRDVLSRLGYDTEVYPARSVPVITSPAVHIAPDGSLTCLNPGDDVPFQGRVMHFFEQLDPVQPPPRTSWLSWTLSGLWSSVAGAFLASFFVNAVGLALPFFTRYVYDRAIPAHSRAALFYLGGGVLLAVLFGLFFRHIRSRLLTYAGGRLAFLAGTESLEKILSLPLTVLIKSSTDAHLLRLRDLERVREFVSGSFATTVMDAPFIVLYLLAVGYMGGWLVVAPACCLLIYGLLIPVMSMAEDKAMRNASKLNSERSAMQQDMVDKLKDLIGAGLEERWTERYARVMARTAAANRRLALVSAALRVFSRAGASAVALIMLGAGIWLIFAGSITPGGLIGSMMLIWRITAPAQNFASSFSRYYQLKNSADQIDRLMSLQGESFEASLVSPLENLRPTIVVNRVVFRHSADREPSLAGASFQVEEGEIIGITGPNGSGKTTLLNVIAGLIQPQGGSVLIGGRDIRQFRTEDLRSWLGFVPEMDKPFRGTLRSNLLMARTDASESELLQALEEAGIGSLVDELPHGLESFMYLKHGLCVGHDQQQAICIARALLKNPPVLLLDDPTFHSKKYRNHFIEMLEKSKGKRTVLFSSHERELLEHCDKVLVLDQGIPVGFDKITRS